MFDEKILKTLAPMLGPKIAPVVMDLAKLAATKAVEAEAILKEIKEDRENLKTLLADVLDQLKNKGLIK